MKSGKGNRNFESAPQPGLDGRRTCFPRGKVLGGSSAINGMVASRGNAGWSHADLLPRFERHSAGLRVRDIDGPRVVDASIMPNIASGNTHFPAMVIAEKGAELILGKPLNHDPRLRRNARRSV